MKTKSCEVNARILLLTKLWLDGVYGIVTAAMVARLADCSGPLVDAARIVWESEDEALLEAVLTAHMSLTAAAAAYRRRVRLVQSYRKAGSEDHVVLGRTIGPEVIFDQVVTPALNAPTGKTVVAPVTIVAPKAKTSNGKGNGHLHARPIVPPVVVRVNTH